MPLSYQPAVLAALNADYTLGITLNSSSLMTPMKSITAIMGIKEADLGENGRFGPGLPKISDSQMLFMMNIIAKMDKENGKAAVIHNGSPLFTGDAGSGPSNIRKYILEHDLLDAIIALPNDIFYNTGIATYIWIFNNRKSAELLNELKAEPEYKQYF